MKHIPDENSNLGRLACTYSWVITSPLSPRWQVTPSHASHALGAHGSPFQPILAGILSDSFNAFIAATAETNPRSLEGKQPSRGNNFADVLIFRQSNANKKRQRIITLARHRPHLKWNHRVILEPAENWPSHHRHKLDAQRGGRQILHNVGPLERREPSDLLEDVDPRDILPRQHYVEHPLASRSDPRVDLREMQPDHVGQPRVHRHEVLDLIAGVAARGNRRLVQLGWEVVGRLVAAENLPPAGSNGVVLEVVVPEIDVRLPHPCEGVGVLGEARAEEAVPAGDASVVDEDEVGAGGRAVVGKRVNGGDLDGGDDGRVGGERVEADVGGGLSGGGEDEVGVGPGPRGGLGPGRAEGEHERGGRRDVEGRRPGLGVVVVIDGEDAEVVAAGREGQRVAGGLARGGGREEAERALLRLRKAVRLGHHPRGPAGREELVGEPAAAEGRGEVRCAAAVDVVAVVRRCVGGGARRRRSVSI
jgi:hypothetical protein